MDATAPTKTKAKQRYLKKKKERRKVKAKTTGKSGNVVKGVSVEAEDDDDEGNEEAGMDVDDERPEGTPVPAEPPAERPTKRRRLEDEQQVDEVETVDEQQSPVAQVPLEEAEVLDAPVLPVGVLHRFPRPRLPNAPSRQTLALQGLDRQLIEAEIVDPSTVLPLFNVELRAKTKQRLEELGVTELFAVQTALVPHLLSNHDLYLPFDPPYDLCVSAPTGSGKTLAYVVPIVETLQTRVVTRLRALVVLPTRDLVAQVRETFEAISKGTGLKIGSASGQHSFAHEQSQLVYDRASELAGGSSKVDILICTPGRLMDHLSGTPNFSLQHLRFLVIDEADRLLAQSFQDWLAHVLAATRAPGKKPLTDQLQHPLPDALAPHTLHTLPFPDVPTFLNEQRTSSCQKLLFSATLTRDPGKIAALDLREPRYIIVQGPASEDAENPIAQVALERFAVPQTLTEHMAVVDPARKPLAMFHLVHANNVRNALVFTKSAESTVRLVRLFEFFEEARGGEGDKVIAKAYSSDLLPSERKVILDDFKAQKIHILVCSDLISRGIDISHVSHVVSYDAPVDIRKYVHRVGRTARAGRAGDAWTLVEEQEAHHFKKMLKDADHMSKVQRLRIADTATAALEPFYETALRRLKEVYSR